MPSPYGQIVFSLSRRQAELLALLFRNGSLDQTEGARIRDTLTISGLIRRGLVVRTYSPLRIGLTDLGRDAAALSSRLVAIPRP